MYIQYIQTNYMYYKYMRLTSVTRACTSFRKPATRGEIELFSSTLKEKKSRKYMEVNKLD